MGFGSYDEDDQNSGSDVEDEKDTEELMDINQQRFQGEEDEANDDLNEMMSHLGDDESDE